MKKIILSLAIIAIVGVVATGATRAFFSDAETSTGNTFTAGAIDLKIDSQCSYNGATSSECGTWTMKDLVPQSDKFFNFADIKPGDSGENTISLHVINNDAWACAAVSNLASNDNGLTEPESAVDSSDGTGNGELDDQMVWTIWRDNGDNIQQPGEEVLATGHPTNGVLALYDSVTHGGAVLTGSSTAYLGVSWSLPGTAGNETQTDSLTGDISFTVVQSRNNAGFVCGQGSESTLPNATITSADTWSVVDTDTAGGTTGKEWFAKSRNNNGGFEVAVGTNDSTPGGYSSNDTTWVAGQSYPFTLSYNGSGTATYTAGGNTVTYLVGATGYGRIGINVKAPNGATTTVNSLALNTVSALSPNNVSVTGGTHSITINSTTLNGAWTLTGNFTFSAVGSFSGSSQENPAVQFSID